MKASEELAAYVEEAQLDDLPPEAVAKAKWLILDSIGCALGGVQTQLGKTYIELAKELGGKPESTLVGDGAQVSTMNAAYANAQLANLLDFDDMYDNYPPFHPGCAIIHTALAMGEALESSGIELLTAVVLGYEVSLRVGRAMGHAMWITGVPALPAPIGPATVTAKLLGLDREGIKDAFDILGAVGGSLIPGAPIRMKYDLPESLGVSGRGGVKSNYGFAALQGVLAARQAQKGLTGIKGLLDADLRSWYLGGFAASNFDELTKELGITYRILEVKFKPTPSCHLTHLPITAAWQALRSQSVRPEEVVEIIVKGVERLSRYEWETMFDAQFSTPCALALAVSGEPPGLGWYSTGRFKDPDIRELASRVRFEHDTDAEESEIRQGRMMCTVKITFKDGKVREAHIEQEQIKGAQDNPMSDQELIVKFRENAICAIGESQIDQIADSVMELERLAAVPLLMELLHCS